MHGGVQITKMSRHTITLTEPLSQVIAAQVACGRYKDISAALQDAAWNYFVGFPTPFKGGATVEETQRAHKNVSAAIETERKQGKLRPWKP
jgi:hypothetical protein